MAGSARETSQFQANPDFAYVPGYSNKRRQIDSDLGKGREPSTGLTHRLHWARSKRPNGGADTDIMGFLSRGYFPVTKDNAASLGIEIPITATIAADGSVVMGELQLLACPAARAQENEAQVRRAIDSQASDNATSAALHREGQTIDRAGGLTTSESQSRLEITKA